MQTVHTVRSVHTVNTVRYCVSMFTSMQMFIFCNKYEQSMRVDIYDTVHMPWNTQVQLPLGIPRQPTRSNLSVFTVGNTTLGCRSRGEGVRAYVYIYIYVIICRYPYVCIYLSEHIYIYIERERGREGGVCICMCATTMTTSAVVGPHPFVLKKGRRHERSL